MLFAARWNVQRLMDHTAILPVPIGSLFSCYLSRVSVLPARLIISVRSSLCPSVSDLGWPWKARREGPNSSSGSPYVGLFDTERPNFAWDAGSCYTGSVAKLWGTRGNGVPFPFLAGERRSPSLHDDSYLQHKQQKKMCVKCMILSYPYC